MIYLIYLICLICLTYLICPTCVTTNRVFVRTLGVRGGGGGPGKGGRDNVHRNQRQGGLQHQGQNETIKNYQNHSSIFFIFPDFKLFTFVTASRSERGH